MRVAVTVDGSAPPEVVWAVLSDVESWPTWTASITSVRPLSPDLLQVGSRVRIMQPRLPATVGTVSDLVEGASTRVTVGVACRLLGLGRLVDVVPADERHRQPAR